MDVYVYIASLGNHDAHIAGQACPGPGELTAWLEGCRRQDRLCQERLYKHYYDRMMAVIKRTFPDPDAAVTILNNGFLRAFTRISQYSGTGSFEGWLRRIVHHAAADYYRANQLRLQSETALPPEVEVRDGSEPAAYRELLQLLHFLPPATRMAVNLFIIEGYSHKEIAAMLGISTGTSKWHVSEGKRLLKEFLNKRNAPPTARY
ncbi:RNA polymerase sigma factor [Chitinophaga sp. NPDC101104]|uniref:RNA polymerase sigma factor n=1 Tax=Chitinophaga sp. NPDC101104 TaxID=3390561 RepID=UPI003D01C634